MILVVAEHAGGKLSRSAYEATGAARELQREGPVTLLVLGSNAAAVAAEAALLADQVLVGDLPALAHYDAEVWAVAVAQIAAEGDAHTVLITGSRSGREYSPRAAVKLDAPLLEDVINLQYVDGALQAEHYTYLARVIERVQAKAPVVVVSVKPGAFDSAAPANTPHCGERHRRSCDGRDNTDHGTQRSRAKPQLRACPTQAATPGTRCGAVLRVLSNSVVELKRNRENSFCCGAGGAQFWKEEEPGDKRISTNRYREAQAVLAGAKQKVLAVGCPFCKSMLDSAHGNVELPLAVRDITELLLESVEKSLGQNADRSGLRATQIAEATDQNIPATASPAGTAPNASAADALQPKEVKAPQPTTAVAASPAGFVPLSEQPVPQTGQQPAERKKWKPKPKSTL